MHKQTAHEVEHVIETMGPTYQTKLNDTVQKNSKQLNKSLSTWY